LGFKLEPAQNNPTWQQDVEAVCDLVQHAGGRTKSWCYFPSQISIMGRHHIPGRYTGLLSAYVDLAEITTSAEGVVELKIWERQWQIWSGAKWVW
jgi:hypothetical protein